MLSPSPFFSTRLRTRCRQYQMAPAVFPALTADIVAFAEAASPSPDESSRRRRALDVITAAVKTLWPDADVRVFGSAACGTTLPSSDIDVAVNGPQWQPPPPDATITTAGAGADADAANLAIKPAMIGAARQLATRLRAMARGGAPVGHVIPITRARVPVVRSKILSVGVDVVFGRGPSSLHASRHRVRSTRFIVYILTPTLLL